MTADSAAGGSASAPAPAPAPAVDARTYRNTIGLFATGVTVITTRLGDTVHGMTANAVSSVSLDPTLLLVCIDRRARMHDLIREAGVFAVNILAADQEAISGHFAGRKKEGPPPASLRFDDGPIGDEEGVPTIAGCVAAIRCVVEHAFDGGDHTILVGRVAGLHPGAPNARPLLFFGGRYRHLAEPDPAAHPAPDPWASEEVQVYYHEWDHAPDPDDHPFP